MKLMTAAKTIGVTIKFVLEVDDELAEKLHDALPSDITIGGKEFGGDLRVGVGGVDAEPVRAWIRLEDVRSDREEEFLDT
jgi:hypothetical protein